MPQVLNRQYVKGEPPGAVYIGRPTKWGNPFVIGRDGNREEVIAKYEEWLRGNVELTYSARAELRGRDLICWCSPLPCHGNVLLAVANSDHTSR